MEKNYFSNAFRVSLIALVFLLCAFNSNVNAQINFDQSQLNFNGNVSAGITSLMYGPDGRLYVAEYPGTIKIYTIQRNSSTDYEVVGVESLSGVKNIVNHDDDGTPCSGSGNACSSRETTGLTVAGTASNPVIYVASSDFRIGAGSGGGNGDVGLDTNSGVITRLSWNGSSWDVIDLVRGLPRSEENHATNGLEVTTINGTEYLIVAQGGHTNGGGPSTNFVYTCEYALSGAILAINLDAINSLPEQTDGNGRKYVYDLPTLDDPTRANVNGIEDPDDPGYNGIDVNDPWGGNDGLNQAIVDPTGPVQILSPGYRNAYDLVVTQSGALYVTDNGANQGWGGFPVNEGTANVTNEYDPNEPGSQSPTPDGEFINNLDHLELVTTDLQSYVFGSFYGGHPNPVRANPTGAGLYTDPDGGLTPVYRTLTYDPDASTPGSTNNPALALPANWPPVQTANAVEGDWRGPGLPNPEGDDDQPVVTWGTNTNGIDEYTASNFGGAMQGDLIAGVNTGTLRRVELNASGTLENFTPSFASGLGGDALGITCNGDGEIFPGTIWAGTLNGLIIVLEPADFIECDNPAGDPLADFDNDGYTNQDELDNGTDPCNGGSQPSDFDKSAGAPFVSDLNDLDDDNDGISDANDPFQIGDPTVGGSDAFTLPVNNDLFNTQQGLGGIFGLGMTGLMNNGDPNPNYLNWLDRRDDPNDPNPNDVLGGAPGLMTSHMTSGTANGAVNTQEKGYQYGVQVDQNTGVFTVIGNLVNLEGPLRIYGNTAAVGGELGHFIGDGTQSNFIKMVLTENGITALQEINDVPQTPINIPITEVNRPSNEVIFYFVVDPSNGEVTLQYELDGGGRLTVGTITAQGSILDAIQQTNQDLAVGFIGTSNTPGVELEGTWDFLNVLGEQPTLSQEIPDITQAVDAADEIIDLDPFFDDDFGDGNLTYSVQGNTDPNIGAVVNGNELTLSFPSTVTISDITIRATDVDGFFVEDTFNVTVTDAPVVLFRVNAGGPELPAIDGGMPWSADELGNSSPYLTIAGTNQVYVTSSMPADGAVDQSTTPLEIYATERFDAVPGLPNLTYEFPVPEPGNYEVRLYMGNSFPETSEAGERIFDVAIEGTTLPLLNDIDLSGTYGHQIGTVITHTLKVTDGTLSISFSHGAVENPLINAIEILDAFENDTPIYVNPIADQLGNAGEQLTGSLGVSAFGGDGNLQYSATGLPPGLVIEPTNGQIGGTIDASAPSGSPYNVTVTVDDSDGLTSDTVSINFTWVITETFAIRINAGGNQVSPTDIGPKWEDNSVNGSQTGGNFTVNTGTITNFAGTIYDNRDSSIPAYMDNATFAEIFQEDRYDPAAAPEMEYTMDVENGNYVVNIYTANAFDEANQVGDRIFDILIEGVVVESNFDVIDRFGHEVAGMLSYPVEVTDGELNILFNHGPIENPSLNAIEVFKVDTNNPTFTLAAITDRTNEITNNVTINASATGGDPGENATYYIAGQPDGVTINPSTGEISGTISVAAASGGPNNDGVHTVVVTAMKPLSAPSSQVFTWTIDSQYLWNDKNENLNYTARHENSFVQAGDKFYLMGGRENARTIDIYDYTSNTWTSLIDSAPFELNHFQATEYNGLIWVIGAFKTNNFPNEVPAEFIWIFDPASQEWMQGPEIPESRRRGSAGLVVYNDKFYIVGGNTAGHTSGFIPWFDEYDPATGTWTPLADAPIARDHFAAVVIGNKLYVAAGRQSGGETAWRPTISQVDVYDFTAGTWSTLPSGQDIPTTRGGASAVNFNNKLVVIGGEVQNEEVYGVLTDDALKVTEEFDPVSSSWKRLPDMNYERHGTQAIVSGNGVHILAGAPSRGGGNQKNMEFLGEDNPVGTPSVASTLSVPATVVVNDGETANLIIEYGNSNTASIALSNNPGSVFSVTNPGDQNNNEGDIVSLQIQATSTNTLSYSATGLPPNLTINENTGVISGTIDGGMVSDGGTAFNEENGLVIVEAESGSTAGWDLTTLDGEIGIIANNNSFSGQNGSTIPYEINIEQAGVYRFNWRSFYSGGSSTDENDNWLRFPNNDDVWFFGFDESAGNPGNEAAIIANLQGSQTDIVFPRGTSRITTATTPEGSSSNGYFKIYRSGGSSEVYDWQARTSDNDPHGIYIWFVNSGTYTMEISERSSGHAIDRFALYKVDQYGFNYNPDNLTDLPESQQGGSMGGSGAADNSPYNVSVTVTDNGNPGGTETVDFIWYVGQVGSSGVPTANASADITSGDAPLEVQFTGSNSLDDVGVSSYQWDFGDGSSVSNEADPVHTYANVGTYNAVLTVTDADGQTDTDTVTINVTGPISEGVVSFTLVDASTDMDLLTLSDGQQLDLGPTGGQSLNVRANTLGGPGSVLLELTGPVTVSRREGVTPYALFGDSSGNYNEENLPLGDYTLTATAYNGGTSSSGVMGQSLTINFSVVTGAGGAPTAVATADVESGEAPLTVNFTGSNSIDDTGISSYQWDFGDGSAVSTEVDPAHTYTNAGNYSAVLTVTDGDGQQDTDTVTITVTIPLSDPPSALAQADQLEGDAPLEVQFTGSNSLDDVGISSYQWDFGDGSSVSTDADPVHTYANVGTYNAVLTVTDADGQTDTDTVTINVTGPISEGVVSFTLVDASTDMDLLTLSDGQQLDLGPTGGQSLNVRANTLGGPGSVLLELTGPVTVSRREGVAPYALFGDSSGNYSEQDLPLGNYTLTATAYNGGTSSSGVMGQSLTINFSVVTGAGGAPTAVATADVESGEAPLTVNFTGSNSLDDVGISSYQWDFGDGSAVSSEADPAHTYTNAGSYSAVLTVTDGDGQQDTDTVTITVTIPLSAPPSALAQADQLEGDAPLEVQFTGSNSLDDVGISSYQWNFGDGSAISNEADPMHNYADVGIYSAVLTVTDADGQTDTDTVTINVTGPISEGVVSFTLVDASTDTDLLILSNGQQLDLGPMGGQSLNVRANTLGGPGSVLLQLAGPLTVSRREGVAPYALFGDISGNYNEENLPLGDYTLTATAYNGGTASSGVLGQPLTISFSVVAGLGAKGASLDTVDSQREVETQSNSNGNTVPFDIILFPNPGTTNIILTAINEDAELRDLMFFNSSGQLVRRFLPSNFMEGRSRYSFPIHSLQSGVYHLKMMTIDGRIYFKQLIVRK